MHQSHFRSDEITVKLYYVTFWHTIVLYILSGILNQKFSYCFHYNTPGVVRARFTKPILRSSPTRAAIQL